MGYTWGSCIIEQLGDYTVIDLETTGLSAEWDKIIEVSAIRVREHQAVAHFTELVNPGRMIDSFITELTGITNEMVADARQISEVLPEFLQFIGSDVLVGHNIRFDLAFLAWSAADCESAIFGNDYICTMRMARRLYPEQQHHRLKDMVEQFGLTKKIAHRAESDADYTRKLYEVLCEELERRPNKAELKQKKIPYKAARGLKPHEGIEIDESAIYYGKEFAFTGTLERMARRDAMQIVLDHGATCADSVTKTTNFLVLGNNDYVKSIKDGKSNKQKKAEKMKLKGLDIETINEDVFYEMFDIPTPEQAEAQRKREEWLALGEDKIKWLLALRDLALRSGCRAEDLRYLDGVGYCELREYERLLRVYIGKKGSYAAIPDGVTDGLEEMDVLPAPKSYGVERRILLNGPEDLEHMTGLLKALKAHADAEYEKIRKYVEGRDDPFSNALKKFPADL